MDAKCRNTAVRDCIIDTGAELNCVSLEFARAHDLTVIASHQRIKGADGHLISNAGSTQFSLDIDDDTFCIDAVVLEDLTFSVILGMEFCDRHVQSIDFETRTVLLTTARDNSSELQLAHDITIPTAHCATVRVRSNLHLKTDAFVYSNDMIRARTRVHLGRGIARFINSSAYVEVANLTGRTVSIRAGTIIGHYMTVNESEASALLNIEIAAPCDNAKHRDETTTHDNDRATFLKVINWNAESLTKEEARRVEEMLWRNRAVFSGKNTPIPRAKGVEHTIDTGDASPVNVPLRRRAPPHRKVTDDQIEDMLRKDIIRPSRSPWSSGVTMQPKKDGTLRFCIDYRMLNARTKRDVYPLPRIDDALAALHGNAFFTTLDAKCGYWQIPMAEADKCKTAFAVDGGLYEMNVMPFGLTNAPATYQRFMDSVLSGLKWQCLICYLDDVIVFGPDFETHLRDVETVLQRFKEANMQLSSGKCSFFRSELTYLGHIVSQEGLRPDPLKVKAMLELAVPRTKQQLQSALGAFNYYRRFIPSYATIAAPLYLVSGTHSTFEWGDAQTTAYNEIRRALATQPLLYHPDWSRPFVLQTDGSLAGIGCALIQRQGDIDMPITYLSRSLHPNERNWTIREIEGLAVVWSCDLLRPYLIGKEFIIETDHASLQWIMQAQAPARLVRWAMRLNEFEFTIKHRKGKLNVLADPLSRLPLQDGTFERDVDCLPDNAIHALHRVRPAIGDRKSVV